MESNAVPSNGTLYRLNRLDLAVDKLDAEKAEKADVQKDIQLLREELTKTRDDLKANRQATYLLLSGITGSAVLVCFTLLTVLGQA